MKPSHSCVKKCFRLAIVFLAAILPFSHCVSQTNISGVVNSYYRVIEVVPSKACVRLNTVTGLARLQKVLILQMKGASVVTTNNSTYGDTTSLNNAGNYEVAVICTINGDSVFMLHNLLNSYTIADKVQLVKFAEYYSATVVDTVKAAAWSNTSGTGGVIAISVNTDLILNAPIYADGAGFKGGGFVLSDGTCLNSPFAATSYYYNASFTTPQSGASKGESVYDFPTSQSGGRGAPANGGGGGNNHNNGGGGGANLTAGGVGGGNSSSAGCTTELHGLGGKALKNWNGKKIFFGGGGGAGHADGTTLPIGGGNGGGIIFIDAANVVGNGNKISANGSTGGAAISDGASGGGAGGTIIMDVAAYSGSLNLQAKGGNGGDENDLGTSQRCYGAGGGGGGGAIYFTSSTPAVTISVSAGAAGLEYGGDPACNSAVAAANGQNGSSTSSYVVRQATDFASYCLSIAPLPVQLVYFKAEKNGTNISLQWRVANPDELKEFVAEKLVGDSWQPFNTTAATSSKGTYSCVDSDPFENNFYRLKVVEQNNSFEYSPVRQIRLRSKHDRFIIYPNPASHHVTISGNLHPYTEIKLFHSTGKLIWKKIQMESTNQLVVDIGGLSSGVYLLRINQQFEKLLVR